MRLFVQWITKSTRYKYVGLLAIGGLMFTCSVIGERRVSGPLTGELVQVLVILAGLGAIAVLIRRGADPDRR